jgi:hypothetical protein
VIQFAIVQAGDEVGRSGAACGQAYSQFAGKLGVCDRHEGGHFFVPDLDEFDVAGPLQRADDAVDAVAWVTVDAANTPGVQPFDDEITDFHLKTPGLAGSDAFFSTRPCCLSSAQKSAGIFV